MWDVLYGDCGQVLRSLETNFFQCCVTSPPYWQLRDYHEDNQIGIEETPEQFVSKLADLFEEVRRVLREDGVLWLNMGDTYCGGGGYCPNAPSNQAGSKQSTSRGVKAKPRPIPPGYKAKDLVGIPWMTALELRRRGWYLRADVIWDKTNGMPEKVTDRPARTHEYVFQLTKSARYFYDHLALKEPGRDGRPRNKRCVWPIPQQAYKGAHFAVFPEKLVETCLIATSKNGDWVLDPFCGSGTTGVVAGNLGRNFVGIELHREFCDMACERIEKGTGMPRSPFREITPADCGAADGCEAVQQRRPCPEGTHPDCEGPRNWAG
jgi:site-specific DNA-methyltransferase (cytosine-N4-specific)